MPRSIWKNVVFIGITFLIIIVVLFSTNITSGKALASGHAYVPCENTVWVTEATYPASGPGVTLKGLIRGLMDVRNNATYCGMMVTWAIVTTTNHTGTLQATLDYINTVTCQVPGGGFPCPKSGNTYTNYGDPADVNAGVNQCANDIFLDNNGTDVGAYPCWRAP